MRQPKNPTSIQQTIYDLHFVRGFGYKHIANLLHCSRTNVVSHVKRVVRKMI